jgi:hypothetical protein
MVVSSRLASFSRVFWKRRFDQLSPQMFERQRQTPLRKMSTGLGECLLANEE